MSKIAEVATLIACVSASSVPGSSVLSFNVDEAEAHRAALAEEVNSDPSSTWRAAWPPASRFAGRNYSVLVNLAGILGGDPAENEAGLPVRTRAELSSGGSIPESFDALLAWPQCPIIGEIRDQSACGSCYAVAVASTATDRWCVHHNGTSQDRLSDVDLMSCCFACHGFNGGCAGGTPSKCWDYISSQGISTGGVYGDKSQCLEYPFAPCDHHIEGSHGSCPDQPYYAETCFWACDADMTGTQNYDQEQAKHMFAASYKIENDVEAIQQDIMAHGPVSAGMFIVPEFEIYASGIFTGSFVYNDYIGGHAVKLIGWGVEQGVKYWIVANSWNSEWGEQGRFRIEQGKDILGIENSVTAGTVAASSVLV